MSTDNARFIMPVDLMLLQLAKVFLSGINAIHLTELLVHRQSIDGNGITLKQLRFERCNALSLDICVRVNFAAGSGIDGFAISRDKILMGCVIPVFVNSHGSSSFH